MKVKIFSSSNMSVIEHSLNEFIANHEILDIKFATCNNSFDIMIFYKG